MRRTSLLLFLVIALMVTLVTVGAAKSGKTIYTRGTFDYQPNVKVYSNQRFSPGPVVVKSGETLRFVHADQTADPHTVSLIDANDLGTTIEELFGPSPVSDAIFNDHTGSGFNPVIDNGAPGADTPYDYDPVTMTVTPGDSWWFEDGETISIPVSAPAGTTLTYFCVIHPWMQGTIDVK